MSSNVYNFCQVTGNLHIRRGLQVACYGLEKALRRPQDERDEPIRTPRFFVVFSPVGSCGVKKVASDTKRGRVKYYEKGITKNNFILDRDSLVIDPYINMVH